MEPDSGVSIIKMNGPVLIFFVWTEHGLGTAVMYALSVTSGYIVCNEPSAMSIFIVSLLFSARFYINMILLSIVLLSWFLILVVK